jgi:hypothetical protein
MHQVASDVLESPDTTCSDARAGQCADERWEAIEGTDIGGSGTGRRRRDGSGGVGGGKWLIFQFVSAGSRPAGDVDRPWTIPGD